MNSYFTRPLTQADLARMGAGPMSTDAIALSHSNMDPMAAAFMGGDSLDEIVMQNQKEMERRRSVAPPPFSRHAPRPSGNPLRRPSMMDFGAGPDADLDDYAFQSPLMTPDTPMMPAGVPRAQPQPSAAMRDRARVHSSPGNLTLDTRFAAVDVPYSAMGHPSAYHSALHSAAALDMDVASSYHPTGLSAHVAHSISMSFPSAALQDPSGSETALMKHFDRAALVRQMTHPTYSPAHPSFSSPLPGSRDPGGGSRAPKSGSLVESDEMEGVIEGQASQSNETRRRDPPDADLFMHDQAPSSRMLPPGPSVEPAPKAGDEATSDRTAKLEDGFTGPADGHPPGEVGQPASDHPSLFAGVYSSSGFDMLKVLMRVATRPNAEINIGAVDMSCAFVVCDVSQHDLPIVYCSEVFERLTGYTRHEILGRNCRFLQAPDGKVQSGIKRKYVDDDVVLRLKTKVTARKEAQTSLINYRKGGQPFMNLLTMIPITWDTDEVRFFVGFQVDLVEMPQSVTNKNPDGTYSINYQRGFLPRYVWTTPQSNGHQAERGQTIPRDDVSTVLSTIATGESELSKRIWDKVLLENTDDVVHVLSLKGLFLYLSPSSRRVLEYDSAELVGTALSSVCHPSDIVPVTRELKDTSPGAAVNVVFRIRRKHSGYTWFESHGSLHTEQGKGRKCIILVGRERPVYALSRGDVDAVGGIGDSELWTKLSTSGMFLFVSSNAKALLDRQPEELVGTSIQALMRKDSKLEFGRQLELARTGKRAQVKHEMQNRRGLVLQAQTILYPGDATEGQKPTFFVAQTRLLKASRATFTGAGSAMKASTPTGTSGAATVLSGRGRAGPESANHIDAAIYGTETVTTQPGGSGLPIGTQDDALASDENVFDELKTTRSTSWQFELRQMEKRNRLLSEELHSLLSARKKRKRRKGAGQGQKDCANCHSRVTPEWRRGPSGNRDLCNGCGLRWAKQNGRLSPRTSSQPSDKQQSASPAHSSPPLMHDGGIHQASASASKAMPPPPGPRLTTKMKGMMGGRITKEEEEAASAMMI
ncbi:MAG: blue light receptor [Phylliscum demangeonii]|nr:MAG: blue light receptor [Phylliscum demangeonii]